jgi:hypothetical protein
MSSKIRPLPQRPGRTRRASKAKPAVARTPAAAAAELLEGRVVAVDSEAGLAQLELADGRRVDARLPQHVSAAWLEAAIALAPVEAVAARPRSGRVSLWSIFPGREHAAVSIDVEISGRHVSLQATERLEIRCSRGSVFIDEKGNVTLRGKELLSRATGANRIKGGVIRLN